MWTDLNNSFSFAFSHEARIKSSSRGSAATDLSGDAPPGRARSNVLAEELPPWLHGPLASALTD